MFDVLCNCIVAIFRDVLFKDVLHRMSNKCFIFNGTVLWPFSGW